MSSPTGNSQQPGFAASPGHRPMCPCSECDGRPGPAGVSGQAPDSPPPCSDHKPVQHRDRKPPWCNACGWNDPKPAIPARKIGSPKDRAEAVGLLAEAGVDQADAEDAADATLALATAAVASAGVSGKALDDEDATEAAMDALENALVEYDTQGQLFGTSGAGAQFLAEFLVKRGWRVEAGRAVPDTARAAAAAPWEALQLIASRPCESSTDDRGPDDTPCFRNGRTSDADFYDGRACYPCVARRALAAVPHLTGQPAEDAREIAAKALEDAGVALLDWPGVGWDAAHTVRSWLRARAGAVRHD